MQSITTKYHGPTNTRGSRISATTASGKRVYVPYDYARDTQRNHDAAVRHLISNLGWTEQKYAISGTNSGFVYVPVVCTITI